MIETWTRFLGVVTACTLLFSAGCSKVKQEQEQVSKAAEEEEPAFALPEGSPVETVSFNEHIRPIISDRCFACHGPDADNQESPFRLDSEEASRMNLAAEGEPPRHGIVPGKPEESQMLARILHKDPVLRMPPMAAKKKEITPEEVALITQWIRDGAKYEKHWAFVPPTKPEAPTVKQEEWIRNEIDRYILAKLESVQIQPSPEADKETLIRRVYIDLIGLPPSPEEIDAYLSDETEEAYEKMVDRALASPHFGERMAIHWLDTARYADTNALHVDMERSSWPWRDWVINAFNDNMSYDQFIIEQLAGDLLPNATVQQKVATSFNRNHGINNEGGTIPEEFLVEYAVDRVSTMGSAFMALTLGCARCHDHKFDPITQDDFFSLTSFFNNIPEKGLESQSEFQALAYPPFVYVYTEEQQQRKDKSDKILAEVNALKKRKAKDLPPAPGDEKAVKWEPLTLTKVHSDKVRLEPVLSIKTQKELKRNAYNKFTQIEDTKKIHIRKGIGDDATLTLTFKAPSTPFNTIRIEAVPAANKESGPGQGDAAGLEIDPNKRNSLLADMEVEIQNGNAKQKAEITGGHSSLEADGKIPAAAFDGDAATVWNMGITPYNHHLFLQLKEPVTAPQGDLVVRLRYKGSQSRFKFYNDLVFYAGHNPHGYNEPFALIAQKERASWHKDAALLSAFHKAGQTQLGVHDYVWAAGQLGYLNKLATRCMVMEENKTVKPTYVLYRGLYDQPLKDRPRERVTPAVFPSMPEDAPKNRLGLAQWLVSEGNPLTARVAVNRFWQQVFQNGIVKTSEDFGLQSESPSHPLLLDYLAVDFRESGWDVKRLMKQIVMSATYRQSSKQREDLKEIDPDNRLLARSPRYRFPAEMIRDNALAASGLLNDEIGGPSVRFYQPPGLWKEKTMRASMSTGTFKRDTGDVLYRRGLYTFWKQAVPPPQMELFDAPSREACVIKRQTTTTPLQALVLMNDETYLEISRELATRLFKEIEGPWEEQLTSRIEKGLRLTTGRKPQPKELEGWISFTEENLKRFSEEPENAKNFLQYGEKPVDASVPEIELAALTFTMSTALNLDETITRD